MIQDKIFKIFIVTFISVFTLILLFLFFSYFSYSLNKQKNTPPQTNINTEAKDQPTIEPLTKMEMLRMANPGKSDEELIEIKKATDALPYKPFSEEEELKKID